MPPRWRPLCASIPASFLAALALSGGFFAFVAWDQSHWWRVKSDYQCGWLAPLFVGYVIHERWPVIGARVTACADAGSPRAGGFSGWILVGTMAGMMGGGAALVLLGSLYRAGSGAAPPATLALTLGSIGVVAALLFFAAPAPVDARASGLRTDARVRLLACFVFPLLVWLVSAPLLSTVEAHLNLLLLAAIVKIVAFVFGILGIALEQQGNVLELPSGSVGVEEACSGIRSLTAFVFAGSFLAAVFVERLPRKIALVLATVGFGLLANLGRSLFLTGWAYRHGGRISEAVHDGAGAAVLALTVVGMVLIVRPRRKPPAGAAAPAPRSAE